MKKLAVVGCGGINSWVVKHLKDIITLFEKEKLIFIKVFDNDVVEEKNLLRSNQNFEVESLMLQKAEVLGKRYKLAYSNVFITEDNINDELMYYDDIILGVDNHRTRQLIYKFCLDNNKYLLDLRAQGTQMAFVLVNKQRGMEYYNKRYFSNKEAMERTTGCQLEIDIENDNIQSGNKIIAFFGVWGVYLKHLREEEVNTDEWKFAY